MAEEHTVNLSRRERQIMDILFQLKEASAEDVRAQLPDPPSYSAVRAMLAKLENKGCIDHQEKGLRYVYRPTVPRGQAQRSAVTRLVQVFYEGSLAQAVSGMLDARSDQLSADELDELAQLIEDAKKKRRKKTKKAKGANR